MKKKSDPSAREAVLQCFNKSERIFHGVVFVIDVRLLTGRPQLTDGTIFRKLRLLRSQKKINYKVISREFSIYEKIL